MTASSDLLPGTGLNQRVSRIARLSAYLLLGLALIRFWIMPLGSSFFCDESGSYWTIQAGLGQIWTRYVEFPSAPPAYAVIVWLATVLGGAREYAMRLPSVLAMALACVLLYRLVQRLFDRESALPAVAAFACSKTIVFAATDARPYAILLVFIIGSTLALVRWLDSARPRDAAVYVVTAALIPYYHYLAIPVLGVHAIYAWAKLRDGGPVRLRSLLLAAGAILTLLLPMMPPLLVLISRRQSHIWSPSPNVRDLADVLSPPVLVFGATFGLFLAWLACRKLAVRVTALPRPTVVLTLALMLGPALLAFVVSVASPTRIFVPRYVIASMVGLCMMIGWAIGRIQPAAARSIIIATIALSSIAAFGYTRRFWPPHIDHDWRGAMAAVRQTAGKSTDIPVLLKCPFIECTPQMMTSGNIPDWVLSPIALYPATGRVVSVAFLFDDISSAYMEANVVPDIERLGRFIVVNSAQDEVFDAWLNKRFPHYSGHALGAFGDVHAFEFRRDEKVGGAGRDRTDE
ncbi:MAG TPA: glycosyltransferase family 39 protein [Bryobacteraceae bacterium]|nr:glycosyltransferase family 39 protein [Bryobacteraceae bacterium]